MKTLDYRFKILGMVKYNEFGEATKLNFKIEVDPSKGILGWVRIEAPKDHTIEKYEIENSTSFGTKIAKFLLKDVKARLMYEESNDSEPEIFEDGETRYFNRAPVSQCNSHATNFRWTLDTYIPQSEGITGGGLWG